MSLASSIIAQLGAADIPDLMELTNALAWTFTAEDFATMLAAGTLVGHRADRRLVSAAGIFPYETHASVGAVMVDPAWQGKGLGKSLMATLHQLVPDGMPITLIATPEGEMLYNKLGYETRGRVRKMVAERVATAVAARQQHAILSAIDEQSWPAVLELDRRATGAVRAEFLAARWRQAGRALLAYAPAGNTPVGYGFGVVQRDQLIVGPLVAETVEIAAELVDAICAGSDLSVRVDIPEQQAQLAGHLEKRGFVQQTHPPVMVRGATTLPGYGDGLFGIAAQAFG